MRGREDFQFEVTANYRDLLQVLDSGDSMPRPHRLGSVRPVGRDTHKTTTAYRERRLTVLLGLDIRISATLFRNI